ncbi:monooxygenase [Mycena maculata]|uniref:Monooxygenase n=1 Tax=Mycena maculata TaxID=230809 RepID=A0AAD7MLJ1_9AGAR|nr:monooxygenase [Mycena maculata]
MLLSPGALSRVFAQVSFSRSWDIGQLSDIITAIYSRPDFESVTIFERSPIMVGQGAGIVCGGEVAQFFEKFDKTKTKMVVQSNGRQHITKDGSVAVGTASDKIQQMTSWDKVYYVLRANFDGFHKEKFIYGPGVEPSAMADDKVSYRLGHNVSSHTVDPATGSVRVQYTVGNPTTGQPLIDQIEGDFLLCAEGPSSPSRLVYLPEVHRRYAGYLAFRGLIPEAELSPETAKSLTQIFTFFFARENQMLAYMIPGPNGDTTPGNRHLNWVWYRNYVEGSDEYKRMMTDKNGRVHANAMRAGDLPDDVIESEYRQRAKEILPPQFKELVLNTKTPFFQRVTDLISPKAVFADGRFILFGDALQGARPHTAAATNQGAVHALLLFDHLQHAAEHGKPLKTALKELEDDWQIAVMAYARALSDSGIRMGDESQFGGGLGYESKYGVSLTVSAPL